MRYLLDTCVVSELVRKEPAATVVDWVAAQDESTLFLSVLTLGELEKGMGKLPEGKRRSRLAHWVEKDLVRRFSGRILGVGQEEAVRWGHLSGAAEMRGRKIPVIDGLLAATALVGGLTLVTRNTRDMQETGATLLDPWAP